MWLENLKALKKEKAMTTKAIAEKTNLPERTVARIFSGDTPNPYVDTLYRIVIVLGGSLDDILGDSKAIVGTKTLATLQEDYDRLNAQYELLQAECNIAKDKNAILSAEIDLLRSEVKHKDEIIAIHNYYNKLNN